MSNCDFAVHADLLSDERKRACPKAAKPAMALLPAFKDKRFPFEESERIFRIARLYDKAVMVFKNAKMARKWLKDPVWALGDTTPFKYAKTELGAQEAENLLGRIEDGVFS